MSADAVQVPENAALDMYPRITRLMSAAMTIHHNQPKKPENAVRKLDDLPYGTHPILAGSLMLYEYSIALPKRLTYFEALLGHDLLEDTTVDEMGLIRAGFSNEAIVLIKQLTFSEDENSTVSAMMRGKEIAMLKTYDCVANLFGLERMTEWPLHKKCARIEKTQMLVEHARPSYPQLYIWGIAWAMIAQTVNNMNRRAS